MEWLDDLASWYSDNSDWINAAAKTGYEIYGAYQRNENRQKLEDELRAMEEAKYNAAQAQYDALLAQYNASASMPGGGGGGGGGGISPAAIREAYGPALAALEPYAAFGPGLMKQATKAYKKGNKGLKKMKRLAFNEDSKTALRDQNTSAYDVVIDLPEYLKGQ